MKRTGKGKLDVQLYSNSQNLMTSMAINLLKI